MFFLSITLLISGILISKIFDPLFSSNEVIIEYGLRPFDICQENPLLWTYIKREYIITFICTCLIINNGIYNLFNKYSIMPKKRNLTLENDTNSINLLIGLDNITKKKIYIPEKGLYQNFLITGTIGTGKTSSAMYPFTRQLMEYNYRNKDNKIGMLILDVKGNYYKQVKEYAKKYELENDLIVLELKSNIKYNPLHKPRIKTTGVG